ncbi:MAG: TIR domain-containing protein [Emergencia sp.]|nr:TIR domain-containing protein [Emergencia sp.]
MADPDYQAAVNFAADGYTRSLYEEEAKKIAEIQRGILAISQQEEPYDVFICYKETGASGTRTKDSTLAQDIYYQLNAEGYKVFFSRITLEDKLGHEYEPYIFAALNSAKVMIVVGTSAENYNAPWVKNEWSRYLALMRKDRNKLLIPCYREMDPYDLPEELSMLQSQDMSKIGFIQDLIRGIKKVVSAEKEVPAKAETVMAAAGGSYAPLLKRADMYREDGDFSSADEYYEKVLDLNPECAEAYWGKLMASMEVKTESDYIEKAKEKFKNFTKRFYDAIYNTDKYRIDYIFAMQGKLLEYRTQLQKNPYCKVSDFSKIDQYKAKNKDHGAIYAELKNAILHGEVWWLFWTNPLYEKVLRFGTQENISACEDLKKEFLRYVDMETEEAIKRTDEDKRQAELEYNTFVENELEKIERICERRRKEEAERAERKEKAAETGKKLKKVMPFAAVILVIIICFVLFVFPKMEMKKRYETGIETYNEGRYETAINIFEELDGYKNSNAYIKKAREAFGEELLLEGNYERALEVLGEVDRDQLSKENRQKMQKAAEKCLKENKYTQAAGIFRYIGDFDRFRLLNQWFSFVNLSADEHIVGIKSNGTVIAVGENDDGECEVEKWSNIIAVSAGLTQTVGLKSDGTAAAVGVDIDGSCKDVKRWKDLVAISAGGLHTVGLKSDGTVVAAGDNDDGECEVEDWKNIIAISAGNGNTVGLKSDGTVVATGLNQYGENYVTGWENIVAVSAGVTHTVGLKSDGTVVAAGDNDYGECEVEDWTNVIGISAGNRFTAGLTIEGKILIAGDKKVGTLEDAEEWEDIVAISSGDDTLIGLKGDGSIVTAGYDKYEAYKWKDIKCELTLGKQD